MKKIRLIAFAVLALLATACGKDNSGLYRLISERMISAGTSKVLVNPTDLSAEWLADETININNHVYTITGDASSGHSVYTGEDALGSTLYALYPGSNFGSNDITVTHTGAGSGNGVVLRKLVVNFHDGKHDVIFPMATAGITSSSNSISFDHLTGGLKLTLTKGAGSLNIATLKVITQTDVAAGPISAHNGATASWEMQGPSLPEGEVGGISGDIDVKYSSVMYFDLESGATDYVTLVSGSPLSVCIPITVNSVKKITVVGYGTDGNQLFIRSKTLGDAVTIQRNKMYAIPTIAID